MGEEFVSIRIPIWTYELLKRNAMERKLLVGQYVYELAKDDMYHSTILKGMDERLRKLERIHEKELGEYLPEEREKENMTEG